MGSSHSKHAKMSDVELNAAIPAASWFEARRLRSELGRRERAARQARRRESSNRRSLQRKDKELSKKESNYVVQGQKLARERDDLENMKRT